MTPLERLAQFAETKGYLRGRGSLNVGLVMTRRAREEGLPLDPARQLSESGGQVRGLSGRAGDAILRGYGVTKSIGTEVGRTNRGAPQQMRDYVEFLNQAATEAGFDLSSFEQFWVDQFRARFSAQPLRLRREAGSSIQAIIGDVVEQARQRQQDTSGAMALGTLLQHLVGAKLEAALAGRVAVTHHGANTSDQKGRGGDFDIGDAAIHVTAAPSELLLKKCEENLRSNLRPIIVTTGKGVAVAEGLADPRKLTGKIEIYAVEQFVALNVNELGGFEGRSVLASFKDVIERYNRIVDAFEHDPSLRIAWS